MSNIVVDDTDPSLTYSGQWTLLSGGSSRQWNSTVHSTFQYGATVSFRFQGSVCKVYGTVPVGNGSTVLMDVTIDGSVSTIVSQTSGSAAIYADLFYESSSMTSSWHTVVITNRGGAGNLDFEFDRVELDASDIVPTIAPFVSTSASTQTSHSSINPTGVGVSISTTGTTTGAARPVSTQSTPSTSPTVPVTTVVGIIGGIIALLILLLLLFLCRRRVKAKNHHFTLMGTNSNNTTQKMSQNHTAVVTPFILAVSPSSPPPVTGLNPVLEPPSRIPLFSAMSAKALRQQTVNRLGNDLEVASSPTPATVSSVSAHDTHETGGISNVEAMALKQLSLDLSPLGGSPVPSLPAPQGPPESNEADGNNNAAYNLRHLSASTSIPGPSMESTIRESDVPPAYQPNEEFDGHGL